MNLFTKEAILEAVRKHELSVKSANIMLKQLRYAQYVRQSINTN